jgi:hypothetical protein
LEIAAQIVLRESVEMELRDAKSSEVVAKVSQAAPPCVEGTVTQASISTRYFLSNWPNEDIVALCKAVVATLDDLISKAYRLYP